jgi:DNA helicase-2/ATP-dependent DNA helicase PcrA
VQRFARLWQKGIVWPYDICVLTFSTTAADEFRQRVQLAVGQDIDKVDRLAIRTFHAHCRHILFSHESMRGDKPPRVYPPDWAFRVLRKAMTELLQGKESAWSPREVMEIISDAKEMGVTPDEFIDTRSASQKLVAQIYGRYQALMQEERAFDFADLIGRTIALLETDPELLALIHEQHPFIMADEFQDTSPRQFYLLRLLAGLSGNVMAAAAPAQEIYRWRNTNFPELQQEFMATWPEAKTIVLPLNYRSAGHIVKASAGVLNRTTYPDVELAPVQADGEPVQVVCVPSEHDEAAFIAREVQHYQGEHGVAYNQMAVLARTGAQLTLIERELLACGIPRDMVGAEGLYERPVTTHCIAYLALAALPPEQAERYLDTVINVPPRGIGPVTVKTLKNGDSRLKWDHLFNAMNDGEALKLRANAVQAINDFYLLLMELQARAADLGPAELLEHALQRSRYYRHLQDHLDAEAQIGTVREVQVEAGEYRTTEEFLAAVSERQWQEDQFLPAEGVQLCTIHAVKGRQYEVVWIIGCEEGLLPHVKAKGPEQLEGERRLFYVGMTRAMRRLTLLCAETRQSGGRHLRVRPSRYLRDLPRAHVTRRIA